MIKSVEFRSKRDSLWLRLEKLLDKIGTSNRLSRLTPQELEEFTSLYRMTASSLHVARSISLDQNLHKYLENLVTRAYFCIYGFPAKQSHTIGDFFTTQFPQLIRKYIIYHAIAFTLVIIGIIAGFWATLYDPGNYFAFVDEELAAGRTPFASRAQLAEVLTAGREADDAQKTYFFSFLFTHNTRIGLMSFSLGIALGLPTIFLMVQNGGMLGAMAAAYHIHDLDGPFWAWILPHGITEFLAIILCAGAGLILALHLLRPGQYGRLANLKKAGRDAGLIAIGTVPLFLIAGLIEAFFRQTSLPDEVRYFFAILTLLGWIFYFTQCGKAKQEETN